jgi:hypothetical protein
MQRLLRDTLVPLLAVLVVSAPSGCSNKGDEGKPNPELKVPNVPPGNRGQGGQQVPPRPLK